MTTYEGKWFNMWKKARIQGSMVANIKNMDDLERYLEPQRPGTIRKAIGNASQPMDKQVLAKTELSELKKLIQEGLVYVYPTY